MSIPITWVDAFSEGVGGGQPGRRLPAGRAARRHPHADPGHRARHLRDGLPDADGRSGSAFGLRWFSPATEINLCGHATLASAHALRQTGVVDGSAPLTFHTRSGALSRLLRR